MEGYVKKLVLLVLFFTFSTAVYAKPVDRTDLTIVNVHPMALERTHCPKCSGLTRVYVNRGAWGDTNCRTDAGDLFKEDDHILSVLLFAWATGKKVRIEVNDQVKPLDEVCKITAVYVSN